MRLVLVLLSLFVFLFVPIVFFPVDVYSCGGSWEVYCFSERMGPPWNCGGFNPCELYSGALSCSVYTAGEFFDEDNNGYYVVGASVSSLDGVCSVENAECGSLSVGEEMPIGKNVWGYKWSSAQGVEEAIRLICTPPTCEEECQITCEGLEVCMTETCTCECPDLSCANGLEEGLCECKYIAPEYPSVCPVDLMFVKRMRDNEIDENKCEEIENFKVYDCKGFEYIPYEVFIEKYDCEVCAGIEPPEECEGPSSCVWIEDFWASQEFVDNPLLEIPVLNGDGEYRLKFQYCYTDYCQELIFNYLYDLPGDCKCGLVDFSPIDESISLLFSRVPFSLLSQGVEMLGNVTSIEYEIPSFIMTSGSHEVEVTLDIGDLNIYRQIEYMGVFLCVVMIVVRKFM